MLSGAITLNIVVHRTCTAYPKKWCVNSILLKSRFGCVFTHKRLKCIPFEIKLKSLSKFEHVIIHPVFSVECSEPVHMGKSYLDYRENISTSQIL